MGRKIAATTRFLCRCSIRRFNTRACFVYCIGGPCHPMVRLPNRKSDDAANRISINLSSPVTLKSAHVWIRKWQIYLCFARNFNTRRPAVLLYMITFRSVDIISVSRRSSITPSSHRRLLANRRSNDGRSQSAFLGDSCPLAHSSSPVARFVRASGAWTSVYQAPKPLGRWPCRCNSLIGSIANSVSRYLLCS